MNIFFVMVFAITYLALGILWQSFKGYPTDWSWKDWASILVLGAVLGLLVLVLIAGGVTVLAILRSHEI